MVFSSCGWVHVRVFGFVEWLPCCAIAGVLNNVSVPSSSASQHLQLYSYHLARIRQKFALPRQLLPPVVLSEASRVNHIDANADPRRGGQRLFVRAAKSEARQRPAMTA